MPLTHLHPGDPLASSIQVGILNAAWIQASLHRLCASNSQCTGAASASPPALPSRSAIMLDAFVLVLSTQLSAPCTAWAAPRRPSPCAAAAVHGRVGMRAPPGWPDGAGLHQAGRNMCPWTPPNASDAPPRCQCNSSCIRMCGKSGGPCDRCSWRWGNSSADGVPRTSIWFSHTHDASCDGLCSAGWVVASILVEVSRVTL